MSNYSKIKTVASFGVTLALTFGAGMWLGQTRERLNSFDEKHPPVSKSQEHPAEKIEGVYPVAGSRGQLRLSTQVVDTLKIQMAAARRAPLTEPMVLTGSLFLDSSHLAVVHTRFPVKLLKWAKSKKRMLRVSRS